MLLWHFVIVNERKNELPNSYNLYMLLYNFNRSICINPFPKQSLLFKCVIQGVNHSSATSLFHLRGICDSLNCKDMPVF